MENKMTELQLQAACTVWFQNNMREYRGRFRRVKNETDLKGKFGARMGALNKTTGIVAGTWDAFLMVEPIVWIEFKTDAGALSTDQKEFKAIGEKLGWNFVVIRTLDDFKNMIHFFFCGK